MFENEYIIFLVIYNDFREFKLISYLIYYIFCLVFLIYFFGVEYFLLLYNKYI